MRCFVGVFLVAWKIAIDVLVQAVNFAGVLACVGIGV